MSRGLFDGLARHRELVVMSAIAVLIFLTWLYYFISNERSFIVIAKTNALQILPDGNSADPWYLTDAVVCMPSNPGTTPMAPSPPENSEGIAPSSEAFCQGGDFQRKTYETLEIFWPPDIELNLRRLPDDKIEIMIGVRQAGESGSGEEERQSPVEINGAFEHVSAGTLIRFPAAAIRNEGILVFGGTINVGVAPNIGEAELLLGGQYEVRERFWMRDRPTVIGERELVLGDRISIVEAASNDARLQEVQGFVSVDQNGEKFGALNVVFASEKSYKSALRLVRAGSPAIYVRSTWFERVGSDPAPAAIAIFAGILTSLAGALSQAVRTIFMETTPSSGRYMKSDSLNRSSYQKTRLRQRKRRGKTRRSEAH